MATTVLTPSTVNVTVPVIRPRTFPTFWTFDTQTIRVVAVHVGAGERGLEYTSMSLRDGSLVAAPMPDCVAPSTPNAAPETSSPAATICPARRTRMPGRLPKRHRANWRHGVDRLGDST